MSIPESIIAFPNSSVAISFLTQLALSAKASKGEADACNPLSPTLGYEVKPSDS